MSAKNRWQAGGGKAVSAARACNNINAGGVQGVSDEQFQRAKITFVGLFIIMVTVWSGVLIGTIFCFTLPFVLIVINVVICNCTDITLLVCFCVRYVCKSAYI